MGAVLNIENNNDYDPLQDYPYMNERQLAYFHNILTNWYQNVRSDIAQLENQMREIDSSGSDEIDRAIDESTLMSSIHTMRNFLDLLSSIDSSLRRIADGTYGYCAKTKKPIGIKRLIAMPNAMLSLDAQKNDDASSFAPERDDAIYIRNSFVNILPQYDESIPSEE